MEVIRFVEVGVVCRGRRILEGVSFSVSQGEKVALQGPSGGGKSTILLTLLGAFRVCQGEVRFRGESLHPGTIRDVRQSVAYIGQEPVLGADTGEEALLLSFSFRANRAFRPDKSRLVEVLETVGLEPDILARRVATVSGGEKQRLAIARALLLQKKIFLCDEITSALDSPSREIVLQLFSAPDITVLSVSHDPQGLARCTRVLAVDRGGLVDQPEKQTG